MKTTEPAYTDMPEFDEQGRTPEHYARNEKSGNAGCLAMLVIGILFILALIFF